MHTKCWKSFLLLALMGCQSDLETQVNEPLAESSTPLFETISSAHSSITFSNNVEESPAFNHLRYIFFYNGGGVAVGDIDNDGLADIYFGANQGSNKLYRNRGNFKFEDITIPAGVTDDKGWTTGISMIDINNDGLLDIHVCKAGSLEAPGLRKNKLYINNGDLTFTDRAEEWGIADAAFSTQVYFLDYDRDGDLDMYLLNHHFEMTKTPEVHWKERGDGSRVVSDQFYRNEGDHFTNITKEVGIENSCWGHSVAVTDFNEDGYPDVYVCNDFREPDHYWVNQNGSGFKDEILNRFDHISHYSMGSDIGDLNGDGLDDLITLDMTPEGHARSKENMTQMNVADFNHMVDMGYHYQYMNNMVQLNRGNEKFSEVANLSGMANTDWSWGPLIADFDCDGLNDVFVTNGVKIDMNHRDFGNEIKNKARQGQRMKFDQVIAQWPAQRVANYMYQNQGNMAFENVAKDWGVGQNNNSNGAAYADLDNDGDLDLVVNNSHAQASIYKNNLKGGGINIYLHGPENNKLGLGCKVTLLSSHRKQTKTHYINRGYLSSMQPMVHFGLAANEDAEQIKVEWTDGRITYHDAAGRVAVHASADSSEGERIRHNVQNGIAMADAQVLEHGLNWRHIENTFNDYKSSVLLPQKQSTLGPNICVADWNGDGKEDLFIPGASGQASILYDQVPRGQFVEDQRPAFSSFSDQEDINAIALDANSDGHLDLYVVCGGSEWSNGDDAYLDRFYLNDGSGRLVHMPDALPYLPVSGEAACTLDFDGDGDQDVLIGTRQKPQSYPYGGPVYLLENINGNFAKKELPSLSTFSGRVTEMKTSDLDKDGDLDVVVVGEWMPITILTNTGKDFEITTLPDSEGWWYGLEVSDVDGDGTIDILAGNLGMNNKFHASPSKPFHVYANDFDGNGSLDVVLSKESEGRKLPVRGKDCSSEQMPYLSQRFPTFKEFAAADISTLYGQEALAQALHLETKTFSTTLYRGNGQMEFTPTVLPYSAQLGPTHSFVLEDVNEDGLNDIIGAGAIYNVENETVRYDANKGYVLINDGRGEFVSTHYDQPFCEGNVKDMKLIDIRGNSHLIIGRNDDSLQLIKIN